MDYDIIGKIYQSIFDNLKEYKYSNKEIIFDNKTSAVIATIVANTEGDKKDSEEDIDKYSKNLAEFCNDKKNIQTLEMIGKESANIYLSFIAYGQSKSKEKHKESMVDFAVDQIKHEISLDDPGYNDLEDLQKIEYDNLLRKFLKEYIEGEIGYSESCDYTSVIKKISAIVKAKQKIAMIFLNIIKQNQMHQQIQQNANQNRNASLVAGGIAGAIGVAVAAIGGLKFIDLFIPVSFGVGAGLVTNIASRIYAKISGNDIKANPYAFLSSKLDEIKRSVSDILKIQERESLKSIGDLSLDALAEVKNISNNYKEKVPEVKIEENDTKQISEIRTHVEKALSNNNKGNIEQGK